jgi:hypothetical protein
LSQAPWLTSQLVVYHELFGAQILDGPMPLFTHSSGPKLGCLKRSGYFSFQSMVSYFSCGFILIHVGGKGDLKQGLAGLLLQVAVAGPSERSGIVQTFFDLVRSFSLFFVFDFLDG